MQSKIEHYLSTLNRSPLTIKTYRNALAQFTNVVGCDAELSPATYIKFLGSLKHNSPSTQRVYRTAVLKFFAFCGVGHESELEKASQHYTQNPGDRIIVFNRAAIEKLIDYAKTLTREIQDLRDRAFVLTLTDTGLRIAEACALKRGQIDWIEQRAVIIGKGDKQAIIRFSDRATQALKEYLTARASVEPSSRKPLNSQPLFARHDISATNKIKNVLPVGMRKAIKARMIDAGIDPADIRIHDLRHYFVTMTYIARRDLKLSQELARHKNIQTTNRYAHFGAELDQAYDEIFNKK